MKKRAVVLLLIAVMGLSVASAGGIGLTLRGQAAATVGIENYFRGGAVGGQVVYSLFGFLPIGLEAYAEYDTWFHVFQVPVNFVLGRYFQILVGVVLPLGDPHIEGDVSSALSYAYGGFPNNFGLGVNIPFTGRGKPLTIDGYAEVTYTLAHPVGSTSDLEEAFGSLVGVLMGLKGYVGIAVSFNL
jgi:hypothetical protein